MLSDDLISPFFGVAQSAGLACRGAIRLAQKPAIPVFGQASQETREWAGSSCLIVRALRARASACFDCGNSISIHYQLICVIASGQQRHCLAAVSRKGLMAVGGRQVADVSVAKDRRGVASPAASSGKRQSRAARNPYRNTYQGWAGNPFRGDLPDTSGFLLRRRVPASLRNRSVPSCSGHSHASPNLAAGGRARDG
jgi:hypothetical protein